MKQTTVRELVSEDFRSASVFEKHSIDFCCHGNVTLEEACAKSGISTKEIQQEIALLSSTEKTEGEDYNTWELDSLADYIVRTHHRFVKEAIPVTTAHLEKVVKKHGEHHPEVMRIQTWFQEVAEELIRHMAKEEIVLFPYIKTMVKHGHEGKMLDKPHFGTIANPIRMMEAEHEAAGNTLESIRRESKGFTLPADACATFQVTYEELKQFETDLHKHVHLENNILFPKAIDMERRLFALRQTT
ncbi:MAG: iron-sulfur cluster repair di-iron protein [Ignavibacteriales bacterium]|nr:iron-sulfur cluster repair di-iron protein [Ignavibacteriales bacterium]